jgi:hypothetical protein
LLALWVVELVIAASAGGSVRAMARVAMQEFAAPPDGRILYAVAELGEMDPSLRAGMGAAILASVAIGLCVWTIAAPLVIVWIQRPREEIVARWARALGPSVAITLWHLALRIAILLAIAVSVGPLPRFRRSEPCCGARGCSCRSSACTSSSGAWRGSCWRSRCAPPGGSRGPDASWRWSESPAPRSVGGLHCASVPGGPRQARASPDRPWARVRAVVGPAPRARRGHRV